MYTPSMMEHCVHLGHVYMCACTCTHAHTHILPSSDSKTQELPLITEIFFIKLFGTFW